MYKSMIAALLLSVPAVGGAQLGRDLEVWRWDGRIAAGQWMRTFNVNGSVEVEASPDDQIHVVARKETDRGGDLRDVSFAVVQQNGNVTICSMWNSESSCEENSYSSNSRGNNDTKVTVHFKVMIPRGVKVGASSVNGGVNVTNASDEVVATTVNGGVEVQNARGRVKARAVNGDVDVITSTGPVTATTVNGSVNARMNSLAGSDDMTFSATNGSVTVAFPSDFDADVTLDTVNGRISTDFPLTVTGRFGPRHASGTIGRGGRRVKARTTNGSIRLRKAN